LDETVRTGKRKFNVEPRVGADGFIPVFTSLRTRVRDGEQIFVLVG